MYVCPAYSPSTQHTSNTPKAPSGRKVKLVELKKSLHVPTVGEYFKVGIVHIIHK